MTAWRSNVKRHTAVTRALPVELLETKMIKDCETFAYNHIGRIRCDNNQNNVTASHLLIL